MVGLQCEPSRIPFSRLSEGKYLFGFILSSHSLRSRPNFPTTKASRLTFLKLPHHNVMENGGISQGEGKDPSSFLSDIIGNSVIVKLNSGVVYKGEFWLSKGKRRLQHVWLGAQFW